MTFLQKAGTKVQSCYPFLRLDQWLSKLFLSYEKFSLAFNAFLEQLYQQSMQYRRYYPLWNLSLCIIYISCYILMLLRSYLVLLDHLWHISKMTTLSKNFNHRCNSCKAILKFYNFLLIHPCLAISHNTFLNINDEQPDKGLRKNVLNLLTVQRFLSEFRVLLPYIF